MKKAWLWVVAAVGAVVAAVAGVFVLLLTGQRKLPPAPLPTPDRPDTPPVDKPLVTLKPSTDYEASKTAVNGTPPNVVIMHINERHK